MAPVATPDITGFIAADQNRRELTGSPITFRVPVEPTWPGGTKINPDTGEPFNSLALRTNAEFADTIKTCNIILKQGSPLRPQSDTEVVALGEVSGMDIIIDVAAADWDEIASAKQMNVNGLDYSIREAKPFAIAGVIYRYLVYGEQL